MSQVTFWTINAAINLHAYYPLDNGCQTVSFLVNWEIPCIRWSACTYLCLTSSKPLNHVNAVLKSADSGHFTLLFIFMESSLTSRPCICIVVVRFICICICMWDIIPSIVVVRFMYVYVCEILSPTSNEPTSEQTHNCLAFWGLRF